MPVEASTTFYQALRKAGVPAEMHIFAKGKHGSGLGLGDAALDLWPTLLETWLRGLGLLTPDPAVAAAAQKASTPPAPRKPGAPFSVDVSIKELLANADAKAALVKHLGQEFLNNVPGIVHQFSLRQLSQTDLGRFGPEKLQSIESDLAKVPIPR